MTYIVLEIQTNADGTVGTLVNTFTDSSLAEQKYHLILSSAAVSQLPTHAAVMMTNDGRRIKNEYYNHIEASEEEIEE